MQITNRASSLRLSTLNIPCEATLNLVYPSARGTLATYHPSTLPPTPTNKNSQPCPLHPQPHHLSSVALPTDIRPSIPLLKTDLIGPRRLQPSLLLRPVDQSARALNLKPGLHHLNRRSSPT